MTDQVIPKFVSTRQHRLPPIMRKGGMSVFVTGSAVEANAFGWKKLSLLITKVSLVLNLLSDNEAAENSDAAQLYV